MSKDWNFALRLAQKSDYLMACQERTGVQFDIEGAKKLWEYCNTEMQKIEEEVEPQLPEKDLNKGELAAWTPPKNQFKNATTKEEKAQADDYGRIPSKVSVKWFDNIETCPSNHGQFIWVGEKDGMKFQLPHYEPIKTKGPMRLGNQQQLKEWLQAEGWKPTIWNYRKDKNGKTIRPLEKTSPKFHQNGELCPNLESLGDTIELIKPIVRWLSLRNRRSVIWNPDNPSGWLANARLEKDGRLPAGSSSVTYTMRQKHKVVANIPRVTSTLGKEMRSLFKARDGMVLVGYDASSLEAYVKGHYAYNYQGGKEYFEMITHPDYDEHQATADAWGLDNRQDAKAGNYGLQYNQQPPGLAETYKIPLHEAQFRWEAYWEINKPWKLCLDRLERHWETQNKNSIVCSVTGYRLKSRSKHSLGSLLVQHTGAIIMDLAGCLMDMWLGGIQYDENNLPCYMYKGEAIRRVLYYHDEYAFECREEIAQEILDMGIKSIVKAGEMLNLNVPLDADGAIGTSWANIH